MLLQFKLQQEKGVKDLETDLAEQKRKNETLLVNIKVTVIVPVLTATLNIIRFNQGGRVQRTRDCPATEEVVVFLVCPVSGADQRREKV